MILEKITLNPFAGLPNKTVNFTDKMNVLLGKNEAGKSTIYNAIDNVLFRPSKLRKNIFEKEMLRFIPIGGDNASVRLFFKVSNEKYQIFRRWRFNNPETEFILPDGSSLSDDESVQQKLQELLPAPEGTCKAILMSYQSGLSKTLEDLMDSNNSSLKDLDDILQGAILESDGISIARLQEMLKKKYDEFFNKWDIRTDEPEEGKGVENRWKRGTGVIVERYYDKEEISLKLESAMNFEEEYDRVNKGIGGLKEKAQELQKYLDKFKKAYDDSRERSKYETRIIQIDSEIKGIKIVNEDWGDFKTDVKNLKKQIPKIGDKVEELNKEKVLAENIKENRKYIEKLNRSKKRKKEVKEAEQAINSAKKILPKEISNLEAIEKEINDFKIQIEAGKLKVNVLARSDLDILIKKGVDTPEQLSITAGNTENIESGAKLKLEHENWEMNIISGEEEIDEIISRYEGKNSELNQMLENLEVPSVSEAKEIQSKYGNLERELQTARNNLETELEGDSYEGLEAKVEEIGETQGVRELEVVVGELTTQEHELKSLQDQLRERENKISEFTDTYGDQDSLSESLGKVLHERKELIRKIENLASVPEGMSYEEFIQDYENRREILQSDIMENINQLEREKAGLEGKASDESVETIQKEFQDAEKVFKSELRKGLAVKTIMDKAKEMIEDVNITQYDELNDDLGKYIAVMTGNRYTNIEMQQNVPSGFKRQDGQLLPVEYLSVGTKDVLGLALRLSMAKYFLKETDGFLIMDDPLVDLDPERQQLAANVINEFAENKQVLVFTCHPVHAEMLSGEKIDIAV